MCNSTADYMHLYLPRFNAWPVAAQFNTEPIKNLNFQCPVNFICRDITLKLIYDFYFISISILFKNEWDFTCNTKRDRIKATPFVSRGTIFTSWTLLQMWGGWGSFFSYELYINGADDERFWMAITVCHGIHNSIYQW